MITDNNFETKIASNMIVSGICKPLSMVVGYIYIPIVMNYLGIEKYGVWSTILTILSWVSYFDIGIGNGLRNKLTESLSKKDDESRKLVSSAYAVISIIMICFVIIFSFITSLLNWERIFGVVSVTENLACAVNASVIFVSINFILSICKNVLYALQKAAYVSMMELAVQIINLCGVLLVRQLFDSNLFIMSIVYGLSMIIVNLLVSIKIYRKKICVRPNIHYVNLYIGKALTNLGLQFLIIQICTLILFTTDNILVSYLYGAASVTPYATVNKLFNVVYGVFSAFLIPVWSLVTKKKMEKRFSELKEIIKKLYGLIIPVIICTIMLMGGFRIISRIWLGRDLDYTTEIIIFGGIYCCLNMWTNIQGTIANGLGILKEQMLMAILQATINIPLSIFFANFLHMNSAGILLGTNISLLISCIYLPVCIQKWMIREEKNDENSSCCK